MTEFVTVKQAAAQLSLSARKVYDLATAGKLASYHFDVSAFHEWVADTVEDLSGTRPALTDTIYVCMM